MHVLHSNYKASTSKKLFCLEQAKVSMERRVLWVWIKVPCIKDFGSCTYEDLCNYGYSEDETCPASFVQNHVPCRCPIAKVWNSA
jgi:ganglioside GM2 activator